jgi:hypothetical protein
LAEALEAKNKELDKALQTVSLSPLFPFENLKEQDLENHKLAEALEAIDVVFQLLHTLIK